MRFTWIDWGFIIVYVIGAFWVGIMGRQRGGKIASFLVAGRQIRYHLGVATLVATELGLITMMYFAEQGFRFGLAAFIIGIIWAAAYYTIGSTGFVVERLRKLEIMTITEYFQIRYSRGVRVLGAALLTVAGVLSMGVFLKLGAVFIVNFMALPDASPDITMTVLVILVLIYTIMGGMVSVVLADYIQFAVLALGMVVTTIVVFAHTGFLHFFSGAASLYASQGLNPFQHPEYGWSFIVYWAVFAVSGCVLWQPVAQRVFAAESPKVNAFVFKSTSLMFLGRAFFPIVWGIAAALAFGIGTDATAGMPHLLAQILPIGILGFLGAGMLAAMMSTDSGYILAWSSIIVQDLIAPLRRRSMSGPQRVLMTRISILVIGILMLVFGIWYEVKDTAFRYLLDVTTIYYAGGLAVLVCGLYWKRATTAGAYIAFACGALLPLAFVIEDMILQAQGSTGPGFIAQLFTPNIRGALSFALGFTGMIVGSLLTSPSQSKTTKENS